MNDKSQPEGVWVLQPDDPEYPNIMFEWAATFAGYPCRVTDFGATRVPPGVRWYVLTRSDGVQHPRLEGRCDTLDTAQKTAERIANALLSARAVLEHEMRAVNGHFIGFWWGQVR